MLQTLLSIYIIIFIKMFSVSKNSYLLNRDAMANRRELNKQNRLKKLGNAIKRQRYIKPDQKIRKYLIVLLVLKYRNDPTKLKHEIKEVNQVYLKNDRVKNDNNSRRCDICNFVVHRASYAKHLKSKKHLEKEKQIELVIPEWLFQNLIENKLEKIYNPKSLKQIAIEYIKKHEKELHCYRIKSGI